jgi:hypothetical protein
MGSAGALRDWVAAHESLSAAWEHLPQGVSHGARGAAGFSLPVFLWEPCWRRTYDAGLALDALVPAAIAAAVALFVAAVIAAAPPMRRPANVQLAVRRFSALEAEDARRVSGWPMAYAGAHQRRRARGGGASLRRPGCDHYRYLEARRNLQQGEGDLAVIAGHDSELAQPRMRARRGSGSSHDGAGGRRGRRCRGCYRQYRAWLDGHAHC